MGARPQFIRFVVHRRDWRSGRRTGLFQAAKLVLAEEEWDGNFRASIEEALRWFNDNLHWPFHNRTSGTRVRQRPPGAIDPEPNALSWIKVEAAEHLAHLRNLKALFEESGWQVAELRTDRPGSVIYEDERQIVAVPFADTPT